ncbi:hypothetical protein [Chitinophaga sp. YIM B06452]|uniref:DUF6922 domain-containing protein n=1 Tax=Chitinophaga sp. YIM B06452 TaxID=3082158 RepID=UPI0031FE9615
MNKAINIQSVFPKHLFWGVKLEQLDADKDQGLIIPRALYMTNEKSFDDDIARLEIIYSSDEIIKNLKSTKERISNRVRNGGTPASHSPLPPIFPQIRMSENDNIDIMPHSKSWISARISWKMKVKELMRKRGIIPPSAKPIN